MDPDPSELSGGKTRQTVRRGKREMEKMGKKQKCILLLGPTATGKTAFAVRLAASLGAEIISADSRQVYRGLDIGSGKDLSEYVLPDGTRIPYHLLDVADPALNYSLADYLHDVGDALGIIRSHGSIPFFAGGTALYIHALLNDYELCGFAPDPGERAHLRSLSLPELRELLSSLDPSAPVLQHEASNPYRLIRKIEQVRARLRGIPSAGEHPLPDLDFLVLGLYRDRAEVRSRIEQRLDARLNGTENMIAETERLHADGISWERLESFGLEYRETALFLQDRVSFDEMRKSLLAKIRQFAKRQDSWFRKLEREGVDIHWFRPEEAENALALCRDYLEERGVLPPPAFRLSETYYGPVSSFPGGVSFSPRKENGGNASSLKKTLIPSEKGTDEANARFRKEREGKRTHERRKRRNFTLRG